MAPNRPERKPDRFFETLVGDLCGTGGSDEVDAVGSIELDELEVSEMREGGNLGEGQKSECCGDEGLLVPVDIVLTDSRCPDFLRYDSRGHLLGSN